jgi:RNA polymerase sigma factor (sigma-70 family)
MLHAYKPYSLLSDERLARFAAMSDDAAFAALYERHQAALLSYCRSITRETEDARDALQSAMAAAYAGIGRRPTEAPVRGWLFRIAHNESINVLRRRRMDLPLLEGDLVTVVSAADETVERAAAHEALSEVALLPERQRGALVLRELHGLGYSEIASALSVSEVNARQLVFAARTGVAESRAGRALPCELVRDAIEAGDRRAQRRLRLRAHLRSCDECRTYAHGARRPGRRAILAVPGGWLAGLGSTLSSGSLAGSAELMAPAKGVAVVAVAAAVASATASHDTAKPVVAKARPARVVHAPARAVRKAVARHVRVATVAITRTTATRAVVRPVAVVHAPRTPARARKVATAPPPARHEASAPHYDRPPRADRDSGGHSHHLDPNSWGQRGTSADSARGRDAGFAARAGDGPRMEPSPRADQWSAPADRTDP